MKPKMPSRLKSVDADDVGEEVLRTEIVETCLRQASSPCRPWWSFIQPQDSYLFLLSTERAFRFASDPFIEMNGSKLRAFTGRWLKRADMN